MLKKSSERMKTKVALCAEPEDNGAYGLFRNTAYEKSKKLEELESKLGNPVPKNRIGKFFCSTLDLLGVSSKEKRAYRIEKEIEQCEIELKLLKNTMPYLAKINYNFENKKIA